MRRSKTMKRAQGPERPVGAGDTGPERPVGAGDTEMVVPEVQPEPVEAAPSMEAPPSPEVLAQAAAVPEAPAPQPPPQPYPAPSQVAGASEEHPVSQYLKLSELLANPPRTTEQARQQAAAADLMAALAPSRELLLEEVPEAASPEEATRILQEREDAQALPDPKATAMARADIYRSDTSVYYRLRKQIYLLPRRIGPRPQFVPPAGLAGRPAVGQGPTPTRGRLPSPSL